MLRATRTSLICTGRLEISSKFISCFSLESCSGDEQLFGYWKNGKRPRGICFFSLTNASGITTVAFMFLSCLVEFSATGRCWCGPSKAEVLQEERRGHPACKKGKGGAGSALNPVPSSPIAWHPSASALSTCCVHDFILAWGWNTTKRYFTCVFKALGFSMNPSGSTGKLITELIAFSFDVCLAFSALQAFLMCFGMWLFVKQCHGLLFVGSAIFFFLSPSL